MALRVGAIDVFRIDVPQALVDRAVRGIGLHAVVASRFDLRALQPGECGRHSIG